MRTDLCIEGFLETLLTLHRTASGGVEVERRLLENLQGILRGDGNSKVLGSWRYRRGGSGREEGRNECWDSHSKLDSKLQKLGEDSVPVTSVQVRQCQLTVVQSSSRTQTSPLRSPILSTGRRTV
jgi:hypothetical protein